MKLDKRHEDAVRADKWKGKKFPTWIIKTRNKRYVFKPFDPKMHVFSRRRRRW